MNNYIQDTNPFRLAGPPQWWLRRLWDFDQSLVVIPSRQGFYYRLAQRRRPNPSEVIARNLLKESDTMMLASYGLIPVTTILATANWDSPLMWQELSDRAPWRNGGADAVIAQLEGRENAEEARINEEMDLRNTEISRDGWKLLRKKQGLGRTWHGANIEHRHR